MRFYFLYFLMVFPLLLGSCNFFEMKKLNPEEVLERELSELRKGGVEGYPLFEICRDKKEKKAQKRCFQQQLSDHIADYLEQQDFYIEENVADTLWIPLLIDSTGIVTIEDFEVPDFIAIQEPSLPVLLEESVQTLPELQPAHIRSTPVATRYRLPLILMAE